MIRITIIIILIFPLSLVSQESNHKVEWNSKFLFESNSLNKNFLNSMIYGDYITNEMKSKWINLGNQDNIINSELSNEISYTYIFNNKSIGFSFSDINIINASFSDDLLRLFFEGNFNYQNEKLDFSNTNIRADRFQKYKISYSQSINKLKMSGALSYLAGNHHISYIIDQASLYTAQNGTYLDLEYNMNAFVTDTSKFSLFGNNGNGLAIDFSTNFKIKEFDITLSITDLGFITWDNSSITLATDSMFNFQGIEVNDIFNFNDSVLDAINITDEILRTNNKSFRSYIPAIINTSISGVTKYKYIQKYASGIMLKWQPYMDDKPLSFNKIKQGFEESNFKPLYYINSSYEAKYFDILTSIRYGGYSDNTNIGLALSKGRRNRLIVGTHHLQDIFNGYKAKNLSIYFNIQLQF